MPTLSERPSCSNLARVSASNCNFPNSSQSNKRPSQRFHDLKVVVEKAIRNHKTFTVLGPFLCVKNALKLRGWIEKFENKPRLDDNQEKSIIVEYNNDDLLDNNKVLENLQISRLLRDYCVDFVWTMKNEPIKWKKISSSTVISRFPRAEFTTKAGLCQCLQQPYWFYEEGVSGTLLPRCYNISNEEELSEFIYNFRLTACISLVRLIFENFSKNESIFQKYGTIPLSSITFAFQRCKEYVYQHQHLDIDQINFEKVWDHQWDQFLTCYYKIVHDNEQFLLEDENSLNGIKAECEELQKEIGSCWPKSHLDGVNNLWILKPAAKSRGRGILILKKLEEIILKLNTQCAKESRYVVQKYIERPLLIYDTKFDIRQWFLVTCVYPLTVWMYKESYLRFCSQIFSLVNTHESVHLSNNAVQCKYTNGVRDRNLPDENMWDCYTFQTYLRSKGKPEVWQTIIYPGMRQNIIGALLASQDTMDARKNCFELFGADFMLSEAFEPWLIEINSGPSMSSSTSITARMCSQVMDDVIKVVIDKKSDKNADTGMFELVYRQFIPPAQPYMGQNLIVCGKKVESSRNKIRTTQLSIPRQRRLTSTATSLFYIGGIRAGQRKVLRKNNNRNKCKNFENINRRLLHEDKIELTNKKEAIIKMVHNEPITTDWKRFLLNLRSLQLNTEENNENSIDEVTDVIVKLPFVNESKRNASPFHADIESKNTNNTLPEIVVGSG